MPSLNDYLLGGKPSPSGLREKVAFTTEESADNLARETSQETRTQFERAIAGEKDPAKREILQKSFEQDFGDSPRASSDPLTAYLLGGAPQKTSVPMSDFDVFSKVKPEPNGNIISDTGHLLKIGADQAAQDVRGVVNRIPVVGKSIVAGLDAVDKMVSGKPGDELLQSDIAQQHGKLTRAMQDAGDKAWWDSDTNSFGPALKDPRSWYSGLVTSLPETFMTMAPALRMAKAVGAAAEARALAAGATSEAAAATASKAADMAAYLTGAIGEGSLGGAQSDREVQDTIRKMTPEQMAKSDAYNQLRAQGLSPEAAKAQLADDVGSKAFLLGGVATGIFSGAGDVFLSKLIRGEIKGGVAARMGKGAVAEGVLEEGPQNYLQQVGQNAALQTANPSQSLTEGAMNQAVGGIAVGGLMGAGFGMHPSRQPERKASDIVDADTVEQAAKAAAEYVNSTPNTTLMAPGTVNLDTSANIAARDIAGSIPDFSAQSHANQEIINDLAMRETLSQQAHENQRIIDGGLSDAEIAAWFERETQNTQLALPSPDTATGVLRVDSRGIASHETMVQRAEVPEAQKPFTLKSEADEPPARIFGRAVAEIPDNRLSEFAKSAGAVGETARAEIERREAAQETMPAAQPAGLAPIEIAATEEPVAITPAEPVEQVAEPDQAEEPVTALQTEIAKARAMRLTPLEDARVQNHELRAELTRMAGEAGWAEVGGKMIRDASGEVVGRTAREPKESWWTGRPDGMNEREVRAAVDKALAGQPMNAKEKRAVQYMLDVAEIAMKHHLDAEETERLRQIDEALSWEIDQALAEEFGVDVENATSADFATLEDELDAVFGGSDVRENQGTVAGGLAATQGRSEGTGHETAGAEEAGSPEPFGLQGYSAEEVVAREQATQRATQPDMFGNSPTKTVPTAPAENVSLANLGAVYHDWAAKNDYRISAYPSPETLAKNEKFAKDILAGNDPLTSAADFSRFVRLREYGMKHGFDLAITYKAFDNGQDITPEGGLKTISERNKSAPTETTKPASEMSSAELLRAAAPQEESAPSEVEKAKTALDQAGVTGKDRTDTVAAVRRGELTGDDVAEAYPENHIADAGKKVDQEKEPWQMTRAQWESVREEVRPSLHALQHSKTGPKGVAQANAEAKRAGRLKHLLYGVTDSAREAIVAAQRGKRVLNKDELDALTERLETPVSHRDVVEKSISEGKPVPVEVLADYPDLKAQEAKSEKRAALYSRRANPWYYSQLARAIDLAPDRVFGTAQQVKAWLLSNSAKLGVKKEEIQWSGITDWIDLRGREKTSKADVTEFLDQNGVRVEEAILGRGAETLDTKFSSYVPPGGKPGTYRELLLTLPEVKPRSFEEILAERGFTEEQFDALPSGQRAYITEEIRAVRDGEQRKAGFRSSHFDQPNILAHLRVDEVEGANGERLLLVVEAQSDWGQKGRKDGFSNKPATAPRGWSDINDATSDGRGIPIAPFVTDTKAWLSLAIKKAISYASENGMDGVVFATGQQNADLYDLSKRIRKVEYFPENKLLRAFDLSGKAVIEETVEQDKIEDYVGKDPAKRLLESDLVETGSGKKKHVIEGGDLRIGGEGMLKFYDSIVPQTADKVLKQIGADTKVASIWTEGGKQPGFMLTDAIREKTSQGLPLFQKGGYRITGTGLPIPAIQSIVDQAVAKLPRLNGVVKVVQTAHELPGGAMYSDIEGAYVDGNNVYLVADNLPTEQRIREVLAHETVGHLAMEEMLGMVDPKLWGNLVRQITTLEKAKNDLISDLAERVDATQPGLSQERRVKEILAMMAERDMQNDPRFVGAVKSTFQRFIDGIKAFFKLVFDLDLNERDVLEIVKLAERHLGEKQGESSAVSHMRSILASRTLTGNDSRLSALFTIVAGKDGVFKYPKSDSTGMEEIAREIDPKMEAIDSGEVDGATGIHSYIVKMRDGKAAIVQYSPKRKEVWINAAALSEGESGGSRLYALVGNWAHNNGYVFIGDPDGISNAAIYRRTENMISLALKFGTTDFLAPHEDQMDRVERSRNGESFFWPGMKWRTGDTAFNLTQMLESTYHAVTHSVPEIKHVIFDPKSDRFIDARTGRGYSQDDFRNLSEQPGARSAHSGRTTLERAALANTVLSGADAEKSGEWRALVDQLVGKPGTGPHRLEELFYSRAGIYHADHLSDDVRQSIEHVFGKPLTFKARVAKLFEDGGKKLAQGMVDQFAPLKELDYRSYMLARMSKGSEGTLEAAMYYGRPVLDGDTFTINSDDKGFIEILQGLNGEQDLWAAWMAANRAEKLKAAGKENLFSDDDIKNLKTLNRGKFADGASREVAYLKAMQEYNKFSNAILDIAEARGIIDPESRKVWQEQFYIPFYRNMEDGTTGPSIKSGLVNQYAFKKLKGSSKQLNEDLLANILQNWAHLLSASAKNAAAKSALDEAAKIGVAIPVPVGTKNSVRYLENGAEKAFLVDDPFILDAITSLEGAGLPEWARPLAKFKHYLTMGVTANPTFKIRNLIRDSIQSIGMADLSYNPMKNIKEGWKKTGRESQTYINMLANGGVIRFGSMLEGNSAARTRRLIEAGVDADTILDTQEKVKAALQKAWDTYQEFGDRSENVNRATLYERILERTGDPLRANFEARDLLDFSMGGTWKAVRFLTQVVPFMNARMQGLYKMGRAYKEDPRRMGYVIGVVALASILLMMAYRDDDDWKKREDFDRDNYWWFKIGDTAFRIPKPFEIGAMGTLAERGAEYLTDDEMDGKRFADRLAYLVSNTFSMSPTPQLVKPLLDIYANKDSYTGRDIETMGMERLRPEDRFTGRTSEFARGLGKLGLPDPAQVLQGKYAPLSPVQIDALVKGYFGWLGISALTVTNLVSKPFLDRPEAPEMRLKDTFMAGNFMESLPTNSSRYVSRMYDQAKEIEQAYNSYQSAIKSGDMEEAQGILAEGGDKIAQYKAVERVKREESKINQQIKRVEESRTMGPEEKRRLLDMLAARKDRVARQVGIGYARTTR